MTTPTSSPSQLQEPVTYTPSAFIATDRLRVLSRGSTLPTRMKGAALFADIVGLTKLLGETEKQLGRKRGADLMTGQINRIFTALIDVAQRYEGIIVGFGGDAITCWFDEDDGLRAVASGLAMQREMEAFREIKLLTLEPISFALKVTIATGTAKRIVVGNPHIQLLDILAGNVIDTLSSLQNSALAGSVLLDGNSAQQLAVDLVIERWIDHVEQKIALLQATNRHIAIQSIDRLLPMSNEEIIKPWLLHPVYERVQSGLGQFTSELRSVVILFLRFSGLQYERDNDVAVKLDSFVCAMQQILTEQGGYLIKLTVDDKGSYLLGTFGAPLSTDDDIINRALNTALVLRSRSQEFDSIESIQIGISQAQVLAGVFGAPQRAAFDLLGNEVNLANRVMNRAKPGQILVTAQIMTQAKHKHQFGGAEEVQLRGVAEAVPLYELLLPQPYQPLIFRRTLIGREHERQQIKSLWEKVQHQQGQILVIEGSPGIGKSHLVADFLEELRPQAPLIIHANCESTSQNTPYYPWRSILTQLHQHIPDVQTIDRLQIRLLGVDAISPAIQIDSEGSRTHEVLVEGFYELFQQLTRNNPLLLVIDDVHWMDEASIKLTFALSRQLEQLPIFLILLHRPTQDTSTLPWRELSITKYYHALTLKELTHSEVENLLISRLSGAITPLLLSFFTTIAQGNPFFTDELLLTLQSQQKLHKDVEKTAWTLSPELYKRLLNTNCLFRAPESGDWYIAPDAPLATVDLNLPSTIEQIIIARLDQLPEVVRFTLKLASVIGRTFTQPLLLRAHPNRLESDTLYQHLDALVEHDLLVQDLNTTGGSYLFRHQLTQESTYKTLLDADRRTLHRAVAQSLEEIDPQAIEALAEHYWQGELGEKALIYLEQAAQRAQRASANQAALNYYNRALSLRQTPILLQGKVEVLHILGQREMQLEILTLMRSFEDTSSSFANLLSWANYYQAVSDFSNAEQYSKQALLICRAKDRHRKIRCLTLLGLIEWRRGRYGRAKQYYQKALKFIPEEQESDEEGFELLIQLLNGLAAIYRQLGKYQEAEQYAHKALMKSRTVNNRSSESESLTILAGIAFYQRQLDSAIDNQKQALFLRRKIGDWAGEATSLCNLALAFFEKKQYVQVTSYLQLALPLLKTTKKDWEQVNALNLLGSLYYQLNDLSQAKSYLKQGLILAQQIGATSGEAYILCNQGMTLRDFGDYRSAEVCLHTALGIARSLRDRYLEAMCRSHLGLLFLAQGDFKLAIKHAKIALSIRQLIKSIDLTTIDLTTLAIGYAWQNKLEKALDYTNQAMVILEKCAGDGSEFPHRDYFICAILFHVVDETIQATHALQIAFQLLMTQAKTIDDQKIQDVFLIHNILNQSIIQAHDQDNADAFTTMAKQWLVEKTIHMPSGESLHPMAQLK